MSLQPACADRSRTYAGPMVQKRRIGAESSETRARIVEAAEQVIRDEGYAAASTRRVAIHAGLKPSLVHYYFPTTDDLLLAVFRRGAEQSDAMIEQALASDDPVRALWRFFADTSRTALALEFMALANHRKAIRAEIARHSEAMRARQAELFEGLLGDRLAGAEGCGPAGLSLLLAGIGRALVMEGGLGVNAGHAEARAFVDEWLDRLLPPQAEATRNLDSECHSC
ncbi:TetR/AcrR family transcriptional regulator [Sphingomonas sp. LaA6.9]|uniref:TetR/AcrR family transcriptional regulator n=1 Tax=Sphingomonas sp. LaA6.9 TaxID=2919914 RepID=UPI00387EB6CF